MTTSLQLGITDQAADYAYETNRWGFGAICTAELAGEIGTIDRFNNEASLALYLGMANLDNSSGLIDGADTKIDSSRADKEI